MNVPSLPFLAFTLAVAIAINVSARAVWRRWVLLVANVAFLLTFAHDVRRLAPFVFLLVLGYAIVRSIEARKNGVAFAASVVALLATFFWLKHYAFVPQQLFLPFAYATIGMSYVFFRILALAIDAYQGQRPERLDPLSYVNYTLEFTCLISGPIALYADYRRTESEAPAPLDAAVVWSAIERIVLGFFKVLVLSPALERVHDVALATGPALPGLAERIGCAALAMVAFPIDLYVNFSGYCDVVIAAARFLRLELPENFNRPFSSRGFIEFWNRWHITLSFWLKTYVYSPLLLALMRRFRSRAVEPWLGVFAYFVTFFLIGLWHGQTAAFAIFGCLLGLGVSTNKVYQIEMTRRLGRPRYRELCARPLYGSLSRALTFFWFAFSMLCWSSWESVARLAASLGAVPILATLALVIVVAAPVLSAIEAVGAWIRNVRVADEPVARSPYVRTAFATTLFVCVGSIVVLLRAPVPHIIYRGF